MTLIEPRDRLTVPARSIHRAGHVDSTRHAIDLTGRRAGFRPRRGPSSRPPRSNLRGRRTNPAPPGGADRATARSVFPDGGGRRPPWPGQPCAHAASSDCNDTEGRAHHPSLPTSHPGWSPECRSIHPSLQRAAMTPQGNPPTCTRLSTLPVAGLTNDTSPDEPFAVLGGGLQPPSEGVGAFQSSAPTCAKSRRAVSAEGKPTSRLSSGDGDTRSARRR